MPPEERIATFDQDGTLWVEHPIYTQIVYCLDRVSVLATQKPELSRIEPFKTVLSGGRVVSHNTANFNAFGGICCSVTMIYNALLNNIGYGITSDSGGYMGNVMAQNSSGSVHGASRSMGQNLCNGTVC